MKLTPLDIHHKEFRHSLRGYSEEEVDAFLDEVADEFERLFKENIDLSEKLDASREQVRGYEAQKETLHNTLVAAQRSAEDIVNKARDEAATVLRDAEVKSKEIIHNALTQKQKVQAELVRIKQAEDEFRGKFRSMLESHLHAVAEISLPDDVNILMGETGEGTVAEIEVSPAAPAAAQPVAPQSDTGATTVMPTAGADIAPPESGFVTAVSLGEIDGPDLDDEPDFSSTPEFRPGSFGDLGERDDDMDIEEID
ncbi:MAG: hypothetical protein CVT60_06275 [Actinobacteria bacterium HGW-Actinobacteria-10]|jgi:cell division initiation protein|nr:MAG: hypothetical protein CVT60_06275 [Actinobacteria bacterium HGW-Actinobacteria-10]